MKNKLFLKLGSLTLALSSLVITPSVLWGVQADYNNIVNLPAQGVKTFQSLANSSNTGSQTIEAYITQTDNKFYIEFNNPAQETVSWESLKLPDPAPGNIYFAVFKDSVSKKELSILPLNSKEVPETTTDDGTIINAHTEYSVTYEAPTNVDVVDCTIYQQSSSSPMYYPQSATFVGSLKLFNASNSIYTRQSNSQVSITAYDKNGGQIVPDPDVPTTFNSLFFNRLTPNLYSLFIDTNMLSSYDIVAQIEPVGENNMQINDKFVPMSVFQNYIPTDATVVNGSQVTPVKSGAYAPALFNFSLPEGLNEFYLKIYNNSEINTDNLQCQFHIKLNKNN